MKRLLKSWAGGRHSPSPRKSRPSRHRHTARRADMRDCGLKSTLPELVPVTFLGYQHLPDGSLQPVYSAPQPPVHQTVPTAPGDNYDIHTKTSNDSLVGPQHFCCKCGKARSKRYHMENPIKPGSRAPASCCRKCREKNTNCGLRLKYLQHFCAECGKVRSRSYHKKHPVPEGQKPPPGYCLKCRTRRKEEVKDECDWEDLDADETIMALPRLKTWASASHLMATTDASHVPRGSKDDDESCLRARRGRRTSTEAQDLQVPGERHRSASGTSVKSVKSAHSFKAFAQETPPTPPQTPQPIVQEKRASEKARKPKEDSSLPAQTTVPAVGSVPGTVGTAHIEKDDCKRHVHVVYIHPPCYHHGHVDDDQSSRAAGKVRSRPRRADSSTTTASSKQSSRRVAFATPEVSSRHEADADYDRTAVPENHEDPLDFELSPGVFSGGRDTGEFTPEGLARQSATSGSIPSEYEFSSGVSSSNHDSTPPSVSRRVDIRSPPPQYSAPPPKVFSPDEIRRLWEQGPQPVHPRHQEREAGNRRNAGPAPSRDFSSLNRESFAANQRSASEGAYFRSYGDGYDGLRRFDRGPGTLRHDSPAPSEHGRFGNRRASDGRYKNDENIDPKTRHTNSGGGSGSSLPPSRDDAPRSQQSANMYNSNETSEYSTQPSQLNGFRESENNPGMYNSNVNNSNQVDEHSNTHSSRSRGSRPSENIPTMYNNQTSAPRNIRPSQPRASSSQTENHRNMHQNHRIRKPAKTRPTEPSRPDGAWTRRYEVECDDSPQPSTSRPAQEAPFTAQERLWTDNPEHARKLREAMDRLERAAAANTTKASEPPKSPPTPDIRVNDPPIFEFRTTDTTRVSTPDLGRANPGFDSDKRGSISADFGTTSPVFTSGSRDFRSADWGSCKPDFGSSDTRSSTPAADRDFGGTRGGFESTETRDSSASSTTPRRDFSPDVPSDYAPPRPAGFAAASAPSPPRFCRQHQRCQHHHPASAPEAMWEHPCGPSCNEFCPEREDRVAREIVEVDSDEEREILRAARAASKKDSRDSLLSTAVSDGALSRLALVRLGWMRHHSTAADGLPSSSSSSSSPARSSVGSDYFTASEASCY